MVGDGWLMMAIVGASRISSLLIASFFSAARIHFFTANCYFPSPTHPLLLPGGGDQYVRMFDARMLRSYGHGPDPSSLAGTSSSGGSSGNGVVRCFVPSHLAGGLNGAVRACHVTGLAFSRTGSKVLASYSNENIYSFWWAVGVGVALVVSGGLVGVVVYGHRQATPCSRHIISLPMPTLVESVFDAGH